MNRIAAFCRNRTHFVDRFTNHIHHASQSAGTDRNSYRTTEVLCLRITLPLTTGNALQASSSAATFTFDAEQTASNP